MEAIKPGSASNVSVTHYETVSLRVDDSYPYVTVPRSPIMRRSASPRPDAIYDEPRSYFLQPLRRGQYNNSEAPRSRCASPTEMTEGITIDDTAQQDNKPSISLNNERLDAGPAMLQADYGKLNSIIHVYL